MILPRRRVAPFLLALLLTAGPVAAATYEHRLQEVRPPRLSLTGLLSEAWVLVSRILGKEGSSGDPFGNPKLEKEGGSNDPFGKSGSSGDPFGNPKPTSQPGDSTSAEPASGK
jgi:hypothetical protein